MPSSCHFTAFSLIARKTMDRKSLRPCAYQIQLEPDPLFLRAAFQNELTWIVSLLRNRCFLIFLCSSHTWLKWLWVGLVLVWCEPEARFACFLPGRKHKNQCGVILQNGHLCPSLTFAMFSYRLFSAHFFYINIISFIKNVIVSASNQYYGIN